MKRIERVFLSLLSATCICDWVIWKCHVLLKWNVFCCCCSAVVLIHLNYIGFWYCFCSKKGKILNLFTLALNVLLFAVCVSCIIIVFTFVVPGYSPSTSSSHRRDVNPFGRALCVSESRDFSLSFFFFFCLLSFFFHLFCFFVEWIINEWNEFIVIFFSPLHSVSFLFCLQWEKTKKPKEREKRVDENEWMNIVVFGTHSKHAQDYPRCTLGMGQQHPFIQFFHKVRWTFVVFTLNIFNFNFNFFVFLFSNRFWIFLFLFFH